MLVAKLKNQLELTIQVSPIKSEKRVVDSLYVVPVAYSIEAPNTVFQVYLMKEIDVPKNPASGIIGEDLTQKAYKLEKIFFENMSREELSAWGSDDKSLYGIFAAKYQVEIDNYVEVDSLL